MDNKPICSIAIRATHKDQKDETEDTFEINLETLEVTESFWSMVTEIVKIAGLVALGHVTGIEAGNLLKEILPSD